MQKEVTLVEVEGRKPEWDPEVFERACLREITLEDEICRKPPSHASLLWRESVRLARYIQDQGCAIKAKSDLSEVDRPCEDRA